MRRRPDGTPVMYQTWEKLLFMHWPMSVDALLPLIPQRLRIDTFEGVAWIGLTPFTIRNARPVFLPSIPPFSNFHEVNVRTYVYLDGIPGVWFFSLDASSYPAVLGARTFYHLPYFHAKMDLKQEGRTIRYSSRRGNGTRADFNAEWTIGRNLPPAEPGTRDFFLTERYCFYASRGDRLYRTRIHHQPWPLQEARLGRFDSTLVEADGLPRPEGEPVLHCGGPVRVEIRRLEEV